MFLIVLAIVILVVSFVIALISLVAEERKRERLIEKEEAAEAQLATEPEVELKPQTQPTISQPEPSQETKQIFPWDQKYDEQQTQDALPTPTDITGHDDRFPSLSTVKTTPGDIEVTVASNVDETKSEKSLVGEIKIPRPR